MKLKDNSVIIAGKIVAGFLFSHESHGEKFYFTDVRICRLSGTYDVIPLMVSDRLLNVEKDYVDCNILVNGQFRSYNKYEEEGHKLILYVFANEISILEDVSGNHDSNSVSLSGYICKEPKYRETPLGREITDVLLAVNRSYGKSDYIPCICWGRNAKFVGNLDIGTHLKVSGRIQSREYEKKLADGTAEVRTAYEVSVAKIEVLEDEE